MNVKLKCFRTFHEQCKTIFVVLMFWEHY